MQKNDEKKGRGVGFAPSVAQGFVLGLAVILILTAIFAALISSGRAPERAAPVGVLATSFLGALAGSVFANKRHRARALAVGTAVGAALFVLTLIGSAFSETGGVFGGITPALLFTFVGGGVCGSLLSIKRKKRRRV